MVYINFLKSFEWWNITNFEWDDINLTTKIKFENEIIEMYDKAIMAKAIMRKYT